MSMARPDLYDVWRALKAGHPCLTISVRHRLVEKFDFPTSLETPVVLRRLKRLERMGKVARVQSASLSGICWTSIEDWPAPQGIEAEGQDAQRLGASHESPVGLQADAPSPSPPHPIPAPEPIKGDL